MAAAIGMVITQAMTMSLATFQRTAETRRAAPTPTIAPVIVCVVETGMPRSVARNSVIAPAGLGAEALHGRELGDLRAHGVDDAPAAEQRAERHRRLTGQDHPERHVKAAAQRPCE